ncbi:acyl-CoA dehydrogenase [Acidisphaera sp. L21]|uniref:acyl-CoA dehydrogenase n=1 Tax=Acidisphaera sp. L21 TaxID=1641851 RepID=UPI00131CE28C|nr:acyl-CoA dehydrogenase [Acidisphaera sp. L21]
MIDPADWLGRREEAEDVCALPLVRRIAALLDRDPAAFRNGDTLPLGWHMILFTPDALQSALGVDGHPVEGGMVAPPSSYPRRMLGGRRTLFTAPLHIGATLRRVSEVTAFEEKHGRSGRLAVATVRHAIFANGEAAVVEDQDVIFREPAGTASEPRAAADEPERPTPTHERSVTPDPVMLFRYSAITFNAHRIHYDAAYATGPEGYPGLIVNGGLTALLLLELLKHSAGRDLTSLDVRNRRPLICGRPARLCVAPAAAGWTMWAEDDHGRIALEASAA